ncbi:hypothetical protein PIB30_076458 [Stylosanthes scabra]|uniref:Uncharacterized protein n=1 Tax=Stylosanthes scabra TaxID=79078 RepID=A0ABU6ZNV5_9FABA|nr:hypothetical protein [Stylosanthes scabra]
MFLASHRKRGPPRMQVLDWASKRADADGQSLERRGVDLQGHSDAQGKRAMMTQPPSKPPHLTLDKDIRDDTVELDDNGGVSKDKQYQKHDLYRRCYRQSRRR